MSIPGLPPKQGLYDPEQEKDSCGIGFVVNIKGQKSHTIVTEGRRVVTLARETAPGFSFRCRTSSSSVRPAMQGSFCPMLGSMALG